MLFPEELYFYKSEKKLLVTAKFLFFKKQVKIIKKLIAERTEHFGMPA